MKKKISVKVLGCAVLATAFVLPLLVSSCAKEDSDSDSEKKTASSGTKGGDTSKETDDKTVDTNIVISGSNVMLQGFTWSSNSVSRNNSAKSWYKVISDNSSQIKDAFEYVWFPPASDSNSDNGYLPRQLNVLDSKYGSESELKEAVVSVSDSNTSAICDIVINHRVGTSNWGTFTNPSFGEDYYAICSDDEGFGNSSSDMYNAEKKGNADSGEGYGSGRDLDHTNTDVQDGIVTWMTGKLKDAGFKGWRYDYVKGFDGKYVGYYNAQTGAVFSVGEHWPTAGFNSSNPAAWYNQFKSWVDSTSELVSDRTYTPIPSRVFDFVLKGMMNTVFGGNGSGIANSNYALLANEYNVYKKIPGSAVTFVDNHDTGSTQALWYLDPDDVGTAYAFILTHPGYPCVAWQHYFTADESSDTTVEANKAQYIGGKTVSGTSLTYKNFIRKLIALRNKVGISETSEVSLWGETSSSEYLAEIKGTNGSVLCNLGAKYELSANTGTSEASGKKFSSYTEYVSGENFQIWYALKN